jgi:hypothetical protein
MMPVLYWTNTIKILDIYSACSLKIQCNGRHVAPLGHIIPSSTRLYSYSLMLHVLGRSRKYQSFNWPDLEPTSTILGAWTHIYHTWGLNPHLLYLKLEPTSTIFEAWTHIYYTWGLNPHLLYLRLEPTSIILEASTHIYYTWGLNTHILYLRLEPTSTILEPTSTILEPTSTILEASTLTITPPMLFSEIDCIQFTLM